MKTAISYILIIAGCFFPNLISAQGLKLVNIGDFKTVKGDIIKDCKIGYRTVGKLNTDSTNVILWPSWFDGTSASIVYRNLPLWIDSAGFYIIVVDALADGISSSPSNSENFPEIMIRDMVNSQHELLVNHLGFDHIYALLGISMGGMQVFEWMVAYPDFMDKVIPIIGTPKQSSYDLFVWQTQADLLLDAESEKKDINIALQRAYDVCYMNCYTPAYYVRKVTPDEINEWRHYSKMMNPKDYLAQLEAMIDHDIYKSVGINSDNLPDIIKADVLIIISLQDHLVNPTSSIDFAQKLDYPIVELTGDCGHMAVWCESDKIRESITSFLE